MKPQILLRNMARVEIPEEHKSEVLGLYVHESYSATIINYIYSNGVAYLPLNRTKLDYVAALIGAEIIDERSHGEPLTTPFTLNPGFKFRDHQGGPAMALLDFVEQHRYAVLQADCGTGKTVVNTWVAGHLQKKTLVLVDQSILASQWVEAFKLVWGKEAQIVDAGHRDTFADVCIVTFQYLHRNPDVLRRMQKIFGACIIDEFHISAASTYQVVLFKLDNFYRIGTTATLGKKGYSQETLTDLVADVSVTMVDNKALKADVEFLDTGVRFTSNNPDDYVDILSDLASNTARNQFIIELIQSLANESRVILFVGARTESLRYLHSEVSKFYPSFLFTGTTKSAQEQAMKAGIEDGSIKIVFSEKKFEKGVDAPRLDTLILAKPMNNENTVVQLKGRIERPLEGKPQPLVIDLVDRGDLPIKWAQNRLKWYKRKKSKIFDNDCKKMLDLY